MPTITKACSTCGARQPCPSHPRLTSRRNQQLRQQVAASTSVCPSCNQQATPSNPMTADHILSQRDGGTDQRHNLRPMCRSCNSRRGAEMA